MSGVQSYRIESDDPADWKSEINRVFAQISERLNRLEGAYGTVSFNDAISTGSDVVVTTAGRGIILLDDANPPNYYRITINSTTETAEITKLGTTV